MMLPRRRQFWCRRVGLVLMTALCLACGYDQGVDVVKNAIGSDDAPFTDWTAIDITGNTAVGQAGAIEVRLVGSDLDYGVVDGSSTVFSGPSFTPPQVVGDVVGLRGHPSAYSYTVTFSEPVTDPVAHFASLGSTLTFTGVVPERISGDSLFSVSGNQVSGGLKDDGTFPNDANGSVRLRGTTTSFSFTATWSDPSGDGIYFQLQIPQRRRLTILVQGIRTSLTCNGCDCSGDTFSAAPSLIAGLLSKSEISYFSYEGGSVAPDGRWCANSYGSLATSHDLGQSFAQLRAMLFNVTSRNPRTDIFLIGHSQGGLIAFQALGMKDAIRNDGRLLLIATLDAPLGGAPPGHVRPPQVFTYWGNPAAAQMMSLYQSGPGDELQGTDAVLACSRFGGCPSIGVPLTNRQAVELNASSLPKERSIVLNIGALGDDVVYNPPTCGILLPSVVSTGDNSGSQWVDPIGDPSHVVKRVAMGGTSYQPPLLPLLSVAQLATGIVDPRILPCLSSSHTTVIRRFSALLVSCVGGEPCE